MKILILAALVAAPATAILTTAPARAEIVTATTVVAAHDLDLSRADHRAKLDRRLVMAARDVCGTASGFDVVGQREVRDCRTDVLRDATPLRERLVSQASAIRVAQVDVR